jgi:hypothetical protein
MRGRQCLETCLYPARVWSKCTPLRKNHQKTKRDLQQKLAATCHAAMRAGCPLAAPRHHSAACQCLELAPADTHTPSNPSLPQVTALNCSGNAGYCHTGQLPCAGFERPHLLNLAYQGSQGCVDCLCRALPAVEGMPSSVCHLALRQEGNQHDTSSLSALGR